MALAMSKFHKLGFSKHASGLDTLHAVPEHGF